MKFQRLDFVLIFLFIALVFAISIITFSLTTKSGDCISNPLLYGAKEMKRLNNDMEFSCSCSFDNPYTAMIHFNSSKIWQDKIFSGSKNNQLLSTPNLNLNNYKNVIIYYKNGSIVTEEINNIQEV